MKRVVIAVVVLLFAVVGLAGAADHGTPAEAKAMLDKAIAFYKANGQAKAFAAFNDPKGPFVAKDLYIYVVDMNGKMLAHGAKPGLIGKSMKDIKGADQENFLEESVWLAKNLGVGMVDYKWENPKTLVVEQKCAYFQKVGDVILSSGFYKTYPWKELQY